MQTICTSFETDDHADNSSLNFYRPDAFPYAQPIVSCTKRNILKSRKTESNPPTNEY